MELTQEYFESEKEKWKSALQNEKVDSLSSIAMAAGVLFLINILDSTRILTGIVLSVIVFSANRKLITNYKCSETKVSVAVSCWLVLVGLAVAAVRYCSWL